MYVCMYVYMYTCKSMSCIYSMTCIYSYMCISIRFDLDIILLVVSDGDDSAKGWKFLLRMLVYLKCMNFMIFLYILSMKPRRQWRPKGPWEKTAFLAGKNHDFEPQGVDLYPPRGVTMGRGREWELPERNDSRNHSRKYSRELWEVTSLIRTMKTQ